MAGELDPVGSGRISRHALGADGPHKAKNQQKQRHSREREVKGQGTRLLWSGPEDTWEREQEATLGEGDGLPWAPR